MEETQEKAKVYMERPLMTKLSILTSYTHEISGFLTGEVKDGHMVLKDVLIPEQDGSSGEVEVDENGILSIIKNYKEDIKNIIGQWHSHHRMGAFFSGGDLENNEQFMRGKKFFLYMVTGKGDNTDRPEYVAKIMVNEPFKFSIPASLTIIDEGYDDLKAEIEKIVLERVKIKHYECRNPSGSSYLKDWETREEVLKQMNRDRGIFKEEKVEDTPQTSLPMTTWTITFTDLGEDEVNKINEIINKDAKLRYNVLVETLSDGDGCVPPIYTVMIDCKKKKLYKKLRRLLGDAFRSFEAGEDIVDYGELND